MRPAPARPRVSPPIAKIAVTQRFVHVYAGVQKCNKLKKTDKNDVMR